MTPLLWAAFGMSLGAAVLHTTLGLRRPLDRTYLLFACIMVLIAVFLVLQWRFYGTATSEAAIEVTRSQLVVVLLIVANLLAFIPAYTRVHLPRAVNAVYWGGLAILFVVNLVAPYGLWYSGPPTVVALEFRGEPYYSVIAQPLELPQVAFAIYFASLLLVGIGCAVKVFRRGERQCGLMLGIALALVLVHSLVDVVRDHVGGTWPYVAEYGVVTWGLIMSVQLAHDFRVKAQALAKAIGQVDTQAQRLHAMLDALGALERNMKRPIETLETGIGALADGDAKHDAQLQRLQRAVSRLREFSRSMPELGERRRSSRPSA